MGSPPPIVAFAVLPLDEHRSLVLGALSQDPDGRYRPDSVSLWMVRELLPGGGHMLSAISLSDICRRWPQVAEEALSQTDAFEAWAANHAAYAHTQSHLAREPRLQGPAPSPGMLAAIAEEHRLSNLLRHEPSVRGVVAQQDETGTWGVRISLARGARPPRTGRCVVPLIFDNGRRVWAVGWPAQQELGG